MNGEQGASPAVAGMPGRHYFFAALIVFWGSLMVTGGHFMSPDGELLYRQTESLALRGSLSVTPLEYDTPEGRAAIPASMTFATVPGRAGGFYVQYLPLQSLLSVPLVWLGKLTTPIFAESFYATLPQSPYLYTFDVEGTWRRAVTVALFNPLMNALTAVVLMRLVLFLTAGNRRAAIYTSMLYAFGTMALPHSRTYFTEPLAGLLALVALDSMLRWYRTPLTGIASRRRVVQMTVMGGALAAAIWTRMDSPFLALGMGITLVVAGEWKRRSERAYAKSEGTFPLRDYAISGGIIVASFLMLLVYNAWRFDRGASLLGGGYSDQAEGIKLSTPLLIGLHGYLMSPGKGLLFFSPAILIGLWGWWKMPMGVRWAGLIAAGGYLPFVLMQLKWQNWDGGWCWGPRHLFQIHAPLMIGAAFLFGAHESTLRRAMVKVIGVVGLVAALFGCLQSPIVFYRDYFYGLEDAEYFSVAWRQAEWGTVNQSFVVRSTNPAVQPAPGVPHSALLPAPLVDSLYLPQHTQWAAYPRMLERGICDWWLVSRLFNFDGPDVASSE